VAPFLCVYDIEMPTKKGNKECVRSTDCKDTTKPVCDVKAYTCRARASKKKASPAPAMSPKASPVKAMAAPVKKAAAPKKVDLKRAIALKSAEAREVAVRTFLEQGPLSAKNAGIAAEAFASLKGETRDLMLASLKKFYHDNVSKEKGNLADYTIVIPVVNDAVLAKELNEQVSWMITHTFMAKRFGGDFMELLKNIDESTHVSSTLKSQAHRFRIALYQVKI